jgi:hypothetical protein
MGRHTARSVPGEASSRGQSALTQPSETSKPGALISLGEPDP